MRTVRLSAIVAGLAAVAFVSIGAGTLIAQQRSPSGALHVIPLRGNIFLISGAGSNVVASVGKDGVLLVDSGSEDKADALLARVRDLSRMVTSTGMPQQSCVGIPQGCHWWNSSELLPTTVAPPAPRPIIGIVNTSDDLDHVGGNAILAKAGRSFGVRNLDNTVPGAWVIAHENATLRLTKGGHQGLVASETYFGSDKKLNFVNGEGVVVTYRPASHTDGDSMVYFRGSDVLAAGDVLDMTKYPVIDLERGGTIDGVVDSLNWILDVTVVEHMMEGGTLVIPGHGRVTDAADVAYYRDMVTIMRDRVREMAKRGLTLDKTKSLRLSRDYDGRFGKDPSWTPDRFIEAIYNSLQKN